MRKLRLLATAIVATCFLSSLYAQSDKQRIDDYVHQYKDLAIAEMLRTGVPASITLAQGIHESSGGQSDLAATGNNHFGIKCQSNWQGETMSHDDDSKGECFRKYASVEDSYKDHSDFLRSRPRYAFLFKLDPTDYEGWAKGLRKAGYATNPNYANILIKIIVENNLQDYSLAALNRMQGNDPLLASAPQQSNDDQEDPPAPPVTIVQPIAAMVSDVKPSARPSYPLNSVFAINDTRVIYAEAGTSLLALAANYNVSLSKLLDFNDLPPTEILPSNQLIYLQKKQKRGTHDVHVVEENETLRDISQKEGVQLSSIMELNNLQKNMQPAKGERIYLKTPAPSAPKLASTAGVKGIVNM